MATPQSSWSEADMATWVRYELMRGKTEAEVAIDIMRAGWSKTDADALMDVVVQNLNREIDAVGLNPFMWPLEFLDRVGQFLGNHGERVGERVGCFLGIHKGQWEYVIPNACKQHLEVCRRKAVFVVARLRWETGG